jgi:hypothetical protein
MPSPSCFDPTELLRLETKIFCGEIQVARFVYRLRRPTRATRQLWKQAFSGGGHVHSWLKYQGWRMLEDDDVLYECNPAGFGTAHTLADVFSRKKGIAIECGNVSAFKVMDYLDMNCVREVIVLPHYLKFGQPTGFRFKYAEEPGKLCGEPQISGIRWA